MSPSEGSENSVVDTASVALEKEALSSTVVEEPGHGSPSSPEPEYPSGIKLLTIILSLGVSIFLVALVSTTSPIQSFV